MSNTPGSVGETAHDRPEPLPQEAGLRRGLRRGEWRIDELPGGWRLSVRYRVPFAAFLPRLMPTIAALAVLTQAITVLVTWAFSEGSVPRFFMLMPTASLGMSVLSLVSLWLRPPPEILDHHRANRTMYADAVGGRLDIDEGVFDSHLLESLRLDEGSAMDGLVCLVFAGAAVREAPLVGWPGVPASTAEAIRSAVIRRLPDIPRLDPAIHWPDSILDLDDVRPG